MILIRVGPRSIKSDLFRSSWIQLDQIWIQLDQIWIQLDQIDPIRSNEIKRKQIGLSWIKLDQIGSI